MFRAFVWCALLGLIRADNGTQFNGTSFTYVGTNRTVNEEDCKDCLSKCCPGTQILFEYVCVENIYAVKNLQDMEMEIYDSDITKTDKTLRKFTLVYSDVFNGSDVYFLEPEPGEQLYLFENGHLFLRRYNYLNQWGEPATYKTFCVDVQVSAGPDGAPAAGTEKLAYKQLLGAYMVDLADETKDHIAAGAMLVSCFFLLLVLAVYAVLPQKRSLPSLMLMAYVSCLATAFLFISIQVFTESGLSKNKCIFIGLTVYYTFLASFTWLNVMSYDMWSTTCKSKSRRWEPRSRILAKFGWYSLYGFGAPFLATLFLVGVDYAELSSVPDFVKPHFVFGNEYICYFEEDNERLLYVNAPICVATVINIVFFIMTGLFIWRNTSKPGGCGESRNTKKDQNRFLIYAKLTLIMGVNWILDVASAFMSPYSKVWYLSDAFNAFIGLFIFIIFVCKKDIFLMLCKRFSIETRFARQWESTVDTNVSVSKRQLSDKEAGSTNLLSHGFSQKPTGF